MITKQDTQFKYLAALQSYQRVSGELRPMIEGMIRAYEEVLQIENPTFK